MLCVCAAATRCDSDDRPPLDVVGLDHDLATGVVRFQLVNESDQPVSAWEVAVVFRYQDGQEAVTYYGQDHWRGAAAERAWGIGGHGPLDPGQVRSVELHLTPDARRELADPPVEVELADAIFTDNSHYGNQTFVEQTFRARAGSTLEICRYAKELRRTLGEIERGSTPAAAFRNLKGSIRKRQTPSTKSLQKDSNMKVSRELNETFVEAAISEREMIVEDVERIQRLVEEDLMQEEELFAKIVSAADVECEVGKASLRPSETEIISLVGERE
jgi:hypothetical protein